MKNSSYVVGYTWLHVLYDILGLQVQGMTQAATFCLGAYKASCLGTLQNPLLSYFAEPLT